MHLIYFADPMCSWCWGFSPVVEAIERTFGAALPVRFVAGGLRPGTVEPMRPADKAAMRTHWEHVHAMTGQPFDWAFFDRADFIYDTEPACRAVVVMRSRGHALALAALRGIQHAFYAQNRDVTDPEVLAAVAAGLGVAAEEFHAEWQAPEAVAQTRRDFFMTQASGVRGFPTLVAARGEDGPYDLVTHGYQRPQQVLDLLHKWRAGAEASSDADGGTCAV